MWVIIFCPPFQIPLSTFFFPALNSRKLSYADSAAFLAFCFPLCLANEEGRGETGRGRKMRSGYLFSQIPPCGIATDWIGSSRRGHRLPSSHSHFCLQDPLTAPSGLPFRPRGGNIPVTLVLRDCTISRAFPAPCPQFSKWSHYYTLLKLSNLSVPPVTGQNTGWYNIHLQLYRVYK